MPTRRFSGGTHAPPATRRPATSTVPASGVSKPAIRRSSVVLPQPEGPSRATISPRSTQSDASTTAGVVPYRFDTPSVWTIEHFM